MGEMRFRFPNRRLTSFHILGTDFLSSEERDAAHFPDFKQMEFLFNDFGKALEDGKYQRCRTWHQFQTNNNSYFQHIRSTYQKLQYKMIYATNEHFLNPKENLSDWKITRNSKRL